MVSLSGAMRGWGQKKGVFIAVSPSTVGRKVFGVLIDLVTNLVKYWYPGMQSWRDPLAQVVLCPECLRTNRPVPYQFDVQNCFTLIHNKKTTVQCGVAGNNSPKNHTVSLASVVPDILLQDINAEFLLDYGELDFEEERNSVLGVGGFAKIYRGSYRGRSIAIKKYHIQDDLSELRNEATLLQQFHHPCLVCLVGVCATIRGPGVRGGSHGVPGETADQACTADTSRGHPSHCGTSGSCSQIFAQQWCHP